MNSLNDLNKADWPAEVVAALDDWQQGDIVEIGDHLIWLGVPGYDALTRTTSNASAGGRTLENWPGFHTGFAAITTQTCDVIGAPPGNKQPWVQVSPICRVTDDNTINYLRFGWLLNYVSVTADLGLEGEHAVDLRHSFPVSKSVLLTQQRRSAFATENDILQFAERLAVKAGRASHHDLIGGSLASALKSYVVSETAAGTWQSLVEQFRVVISEGTRLHPRRIKLMVITREPANAELTKGINDCVKGWKRRERKLLSQARIDVEKVEFRRVTELLVDDYRSAVHLPVEEVTRRYWF